RLLMLRHFILSAASLVFVLLLRPPPRSPLFPYTTLFRSPGGSPGPGRSPPRRRPPSGFSPRRTAGRGCGAPAPPAGPEHPSGRRSEEHTSELQSRFDLVCRLLLEKKKTETITVTYP